MSYCPKNNLQPAFTLIEMLAATALTAALMLATLGVIASFRSSGPPADTGAATALRAALDLLESDLLAAEAMKGEGGMLELTTCVLLDVDGGRRERLPASVRYELRAADAALCLVRRQRPLTAGGSERSDLVLVGVKDLSVLVPDRQDGPWRPLASPVRPPAQLEVVLTRGGVDGDATARRLVTRR